MSSNWILPALVTGGGVVFAGGVAVALRFISSTTRRIIAEIVTDVLSGFKTEIDKRFDVNDENTEKAAEKAEQAAERAAALDLELARQFGGNGGGLREAINRLNADVSFLKGAASSAASSTVVKQ
jgi:hypothetical protein